MTRPDVIARLGGLTLGGQLLMSYVIGRDEKGEILEFAVDTAAGVVRVREITEKYEPNQT